MFVFGGDYKHARTWQALQSMVSSRRDIKTICLWNNLVTFYRRSRNKMSYCVIPLKHKSTSASHGNVHVSCKLERTPVFEFLDIFIFCLYFMGNIFIWTYFVHETAPMNERSKNQRTEYVSRPYI